MHARSGQLKISPDRIDDAVAKLENEQIPKYKEQEGYKGFTVLADRQSGKLLGISFWENEDALRNSDDLGQEARSQMAEAGGSSEEPVREQWEVVFDDMA